MIKRELLFKCRMSVYEAKNWIATVFSRNARTTVEDTECYGDESEIDRVQEPLPPDCFGLS